MANIEQSEDISQRAHPCLEFFCPSCLPQSKSSQTFEAESVHFWENYLEFLTDPEVDCNGQS